MVEIEEKMYGRSKLFSPSFLGRFLFKLGKGKMSSSMEHLTSLESGFGNFSSVDVFFQADEGGGGGHFGG